MVDALALNGEEGRGMAAKSHGELSNEHWSVDIRMGKPDRKVIREEVNAGNWKILVPAGKEIERDSRSSASELGRA